MDELGGWPYISAALLKKLDEVCPERCPSPEETVAEIHHYAGRRAMVNFLRSISNEQNRTEEPNE